MQTPHDESDPASGFTIRCASREELSAVLAVQRRAFSRVARQFSIPPEDFSAVREELHALDGFYERGGAFLVAETPEGEIVGSVRAIPAENDPGTIEIGRLVVEDGWERRGIGKSLMRAVEVEFPDAVRFELFTGAEAKIPVQLYTGLGYSIFRQERMGEGFELVWMEKPGPRAR